MQFAFWRKRSSGWIFHIYRWSIPPSYLSILLKDPSTSFHSLACNPPIRSGLWFPHIEVSPHLGILIRYLQALWHNLRVLLGYFLITGSGGQSQCWRTWLEENARAGSVAGWFAPHTAQRSPEDLCWRSLQKEWHRKQCGPMEQSNTDYFKSNYLHKKLDPACVQKPFQVRTPLLFVQEVIGIQHLVIIEYLAQLLLLRFSRGVQRVKPCNHKTMGRYLTGGFSRCDRHWERISLQRIITERGAHHDPEEGPPTQSGETHWSADSAHPSPFSHGWLSCLTWSERTAVVLFPGPWSSDRHGLSFLLYEAMFLAPAFGGRLHPGQRCLIEKDWSLLMGPSSRCSIARKTHWGTREKSISIDMRSDTASDKHFGGNRWLIKTSGMLVEAILDYLDGKNP